MIASKLERDPRDLIGFISHDANQNLQGADNRSEKHDIHSFFSSHVIEWWFFHLFAGNCAPGQFKLMTCMTCTIGT